MTMIPHKLLIILSGALMVDLAVQPGCSTDLASPALRHDPSIQAHEVVAYDPILLRTMLRTLKRSPSAQSRVTFVGECLPLMRMRGSSILSVSYRDRSLMMLARKLPLLMGSMDAFQDKIQKPTRAIKLPRSYIFCLQR